MRVLVTGASGNIGTSVLTALASEPRVDRVVGVSRRRPEWSPPKTSFMETDIRSPEIIEICREVDAVIHLAWAFQPTHRPITTWDVNVIGGINVFEAAAKTGVRALVYASSVGAYAPGPGRTVDESWPTHSLPTAAYGREKAYLERYLDSYELREPGIRVARLRPAFVFQRRSGSEQRRIFAGPLLPPMLLRRGRLPLIPVPHGLRFQAVHASDVGEAFRLVLLSDASGAFNVAADPVIDAAELGEIMGARIVSVPAKLAVGATALAWRLHVVRADDALLNLFLQLPTLDASRIRDELGWYPRHTGSDALREMLDGLAQGAGAPTPPMHPDSGPVRAAGGS